MAGSFAEAGEEGADVGGEGVGVGMGGVVTVHFGRYVPGGDAGVVTVGEARIDLRSPS
jgi:hypothetical protein